MNRCYDCIYCDDFNDICDNVYSKYFEMDIDAISDCNDFVEIGGDDDF